MLRSKMISYLLHYSSENVFFRRISNAYLGPQGDLPLKIHECSLEEKKTYKKSIRYDDLVLNTRKKRIFIYISIQQCNCFPLETNSRQKTLRNAYMQHLIAKASL